MKLAQKKHVIWKMVDGEAVFLDSWNGNYFSLNGTGSRIWLLLTTGTPIEQIATIVSSEYEISTESAKADIAELIETLLKNEIAEEVKDEP